MKTLLKIFCLILIIYAVWFPFSYFGKNQDKKEVRVSHIMVDTLERANEIKEELESGKTFESMLKDEKICDEKTLCGDLGYAHKGKWEPQLENVVFKMSKDEISNPINTQKGWHIIKITRINYYSDSENFKYNPYKYLEL